MYIVLVHLFVFFQFHCRVILTQLECFLPGRQGTLYSNYCLGRRYSRVIDAFGTEYSRVLLARSAPCLRHRQHWWCKSWKAQFASKIGKHVFILVPRENSGWNHKWSAAQIKYFEFEFLEQDEAMCVFTEMRLDAFWESPAETCSRITISFRHVLRRTFDIFRWNFLGFEKSQIHILVFQSHFALY